MNARIALAYVAAARRGARVRVLLDAYFDGPGGPQVPQPVVDAMETTLNIA